MKQLIIGVLAIIGSILISLPSQAKTLILEGNLEGSIAMRQAMEFSVSKGTVSSFSFKFALPATMNSKTVRQDIENPDVGISPQPSSSNVETDKFGNRFQRITWQNVNQDIRVNLNYTTKIRSQLGTIESKAPFPVGRVGTSESLYLQHTEMVQGDAAIKSLARELTSSAKGEYEAVSAIINWVTDNIKYTFNPPQYDASYTLRTKSGNCQNFAHLSIALLRAVGIPARIVGGITLKDPWKVPIDGRNSIVQSMGQGGHAWLEVYFPDLGWLPYDPQQSRQFTSSRHIKQTHGLDSRDINDTWRGAPYLPAYSELIEGRFVVDDIQLKMKRAALAPRPYIMSNQIESTSSNVPGDKGDSSAITPPAIIAAASGAVASSKPIPAPQGTGAGPAEARIVSDKPETGTPGDGKENTKPTKPPVHKPVKPTKPVPVEQPPLHPGETVAKRPKPGTALVFGNMEFPEKVNLVNIQGNTGTRVFERETSEYVTSQYIYAQAIQVKDPMSLDKISLAMRKFGGDGAIYIDLVKDKDGKPDIMDGVRSNMLDLEKISRKPGYYWVDFSFPLVSSKPQRLEPGKYWVVFRASGEAIMNWFFTPGKPYGNGDDTRSTAKGYKWEDILNYDFVFKVTGKAI